MAVDIDHEMELDNAASSEGRIVKLLDVSMLSDTTYVSEEQDGSTGGGCGGRSRDNASSTPARTNTSATKTPQSRRHVTRSSTSSAASASVSLYEDALAELSSTKTPVLPTRSRATPLRRSARQAAESNESSVTICEDKTSTLGTSLAKWSSDITMNRKPAELPDVIDAAAKNIGSDSTEVRKQAASSISREQVRPSSYNKTSTLGRLNKSTTTTSDSAKKQGLHSRTRSLDHLKTSNMKDASMKHLSSNTKPGAAKVDRSRSQLEERKETHKSLSANKSRTQMKLTIPRTPQLLKRELKFLHMVPVQNTEQQELSRIRELRRALADKRRLAEESRIKAKAAPAHSMAVRSAQPLTEPDSFHFATDDRLKTHGMETRQDVDQGREARFASDLRRYDPVTTKPKGPTLPQPFRLSAERKRKLSEGDLPCSKFESIAEKVIKFSSRTPERFRRRPSPVGGTSLDRDRRNPTNDNDDGRLTVPKTPNLETRRRLRPNTAVSQSDREEMEIQEAKKNQFRAKPVNPVIFVNSTHGIKKVILRECTVPEEFHMEIEQRLKQRHANEVTDKTESFEFHARPVPKAILDGPVGVQPAKPASVTVPQSPAFALKRSTRALAAAASLANEHEQVEPLPLKVRPLHPVPHAGIPFQPRLEHHTTDVMPFSFDERDKEMFAKKEEKIKTVLEEEKKAREFKANPLRDLTPVLPRKRTLPVTKPVPFDLEVDVRGAVKAEEFRKQREEDVKKVKDLATFKAQFPNVLANKPFVPAKSNRPLTELRDVQLNTDRRAESRVEWEKWRHEKQMDAAMERCARERQRLEAEAAELARARAQAVHKAQPVRHYRGVDIHPSSQILTLPESPKFSERLRSKNPHH